MKLIVIEIVNFKKAHNNFAFCILHFAFQIPLHKKMRDVLQNIINVAAGKRVAVSVSGGSDSMCLLSLFFKCREHLASLEVLIFDHKIREQSSIEARFVVEFCKVHDVPYTIYEYPENDTLLGTGTELKAREWRNGVFEQVLNITSDKVSNSKMSQRVDCVALGHHMDDQIETVLYRIFRGTGIKGLGGMSITNGGLYRPLLNTSKLEINEYISKNSIPHIQDLSNFDNKYDRNFIRNVIIPDIRTRWNTNNISNLADIAKHTSEYMASCIDKNLIIKQVNDVLIPISVLDSALSFEYIAYALSLCKIVPTQSITSRIMSIVPLQSGKYVMLDNGIKAQKEYEYIRLIKSDAKVFNTESNIKFEQATGDAEIFNTKFVGIGDYEFCGTKWSISTEPHLQSIYFDIDKIPTNAIWRHRQVGDVFKPFNNNNKSLKKYLIDKKITQSLRDNLTLLCSENNVLMILGVEISDHIKCDENTKNKAFIKII